MTVDRFDLPAGPNGEEQFVLRQTSPSGADMRQMERDAVPFYREALLLQTKDVMINVLVKGWQIVTRDGELDVLELQREEELLKPEYRKRYTKFPEKTLRAIHADLDLIVDRIRPIDAAQDVVNRIVNLTFGMTKEDAETLNGLATTLAEVMGIGGPNPGSQAA